MSITQSDLQRQQERLHNLNRAELRNLVQAAQNDVSDIRYRYECGRLTEDEVTERTRRPKLLTLAVAQELERREAGR